MYRLFLKKHRAYKRNRDQRQYKRNAITFINKKLFY